MTMMTGQGPKSVTGAEHAGRAMAFMVRFTASYHDSNIPIVPKRYLKPLPYFIFALENEKIQ
jgi:hypothetical protein